jgi:hypothetical protein
MEVIWFRKWIDYIVTISFMTSFAYPYLFYASYDLPYFRQGHSLDISQLYIIKLNMSWKGLKWIKKLPFSRFANLPCWAEIELQMLCVQILMLAVTEHVVYSHLKPSPPSTTTPHPPPPHSLRGMQNAHTCRMFFEKDML